MEKIIQFIKQKNHLEMFLIICLLILLSPLYIFHLSSIPTSVHGDEAETALQALQIVKGNAGIVGTGWFSLPLLSFLPHGIFMLILGDNITSDRLGSVIFGIMVLPIFFLFVRDFFDRRIALTSTLLLGTSNLWLALSRLGITYVQSTFFVVLVSYLLFKALENNKLRYFVVAGLMLGLSMYSNFAVRILPFLVFPFLLFYLFKFKHDLKSKIVNVALFLICSFIIFLPQGIFYINNPGTISSREQTIFVFSDTAKQWSNYENLNNLQILFVQTEKTLNVFAGDNSTQYGNKQQLLDFASIIFLIIGILFVLVKNFKNYKYYYLLFWLFLALAGQILTSIPPPFFLPRFVVGLPVVYLFITIGLFISSEIIAKLTRSLRYFYFIVALFVVLIISWNLYVYFIDYPKQIAGDPNARAATKIASILNNNYKNYTAYFYTSPNLYSDFGTLRFLSSKINRVNLDANNAVVTANTNGTKSIYIIYPQYKYLIQELSSKFPGGNINEVRDINGSVQFYTFAY